MSSITIFSLGIIGVVFILFLIVLVILYQANHLIKKIKEAENIKQAIEESKIKSLGEEYFKSLKIKVPGGYKTNYPALYFLNAESVTKAFSINLRLQDTASGTLVGLGLLGTFLGLTVGIHGFDSTNSENIQQSIQGLLEGMGTAFSTSLLGMLCSLIYTTIDKVIRNKFIRNIEEITEKLDSQYYIDDGSLQELQQMALVDKVIESVKNELNAKLTYANENGENIAVGNAIREILTENSEQSRALKSFSTDLAMQLNEGFDEVLSRQMQQRILPLMESVDATTKSVIEHIDQMASTVASPASGMMESVVEEIKKSMMAIVSEFKTSLSSSTTSQLETLAAQLGEASVMMGQFPQNMESISATLQVTIEEVKAAIQEISNTSAHANSTAMQQMQEQIAYATGSISNAIAEVKEVMGSITESSQEQSNKLIFQLSSAAEKMGSFLDNTIANLSNSIQSSMSSITENVNSQQADLIALQEDATAQTRKLLDSFNEGLERMKKMNDDIVGTMNGFKQAQGEISISTGNLRTISGDMKLATELFNKGQNDYAEKLNQLQLASQKGMDRISELLINSGQMTDEYAKKFEIIKQGLAGIFSQLQTGLTEYSRTVQATTQKYLDQYTTNLTQTTDALASTIQQQNEVVETLSEILERKKL